MKRPSIITQLIGCFLIAIIVPISLLGISMLNKTGNILKSNMELTSKQTLEESKKAFTYYFEGLSQQVNSLSSGNEVKCLYDKGDYEHNSKLVQDALLVALKTTKGSVRAHYATSKGDLFSVWIERKGEREDLKQSIESGVDVIEKAWYNDAIKNKKDTYATFSEPYTDKKTNSSIITVSQKVEESGVVVGVVAIDIDFKTVESFVQEIGLLNTGYVLMTNDNGDVLVNDTKNLLTKNNLCIFGILAEIPLSKEPTDEEIKKANRILTYNRSLGKNDLFILVFNDLVTDWKLVGVINPHEETKGNNEAIVTSVLMISLIGIFIGLIVSGLMTSSIRKQITKINTIIKQVATGDFTKRIALKGHNEFAQLADYVNTMIDNTCKLMKDVDYSAAALLSISESISTISDETQTTSNIVTSSIQQIAIGSTNQVHSMQEARTEVENLATQLEETHNYVSGMHNRFETTRKLSISGLEQLKSLTLQAERTKGNSIASTEIVLGMAKSIEKINFISSVIAGITQQTNLLSLNASIEAARAGECGRGFAVVAGEIRKLADESKRSTDEIRQIVEEINLKAREAEGAMKESQRFIAKQEDSILETGQVFHEILDAVTHLVEEIDYIKRLNAKMSTSKEVVIERIEGIATISEESAAATEEVTAASEEVNATIYELNTYTLKLKAMANQLQGELSKFTL